MNSTPYEYPETPRSCDTCGRVGPLRLIVYATASGFAVGHACGHGACGAIEDCSPPYPTEEEALSVRSHIDSFGLLPHEMNFSEFDPGPLRHKA